MQRILVIDDDPAVRMALKLLLEHEGFEVVVTDDSRAGLQALESSGFDLVIVDIFMPGMDGLETIKGLQQRMSGLPIIAMSGFMFRDTGSPAPDFLAMASKLGAACSLHKPFRPHELVEAVRSSLGGAAPTPRPIRVAPAAD